MLAFQLPAAFKLPHSVLEPPFLHLEAKIYNRNIEHHYEVANEVQKHEAHQRVAHLGAHFYFDKVSEAVEMVDAPEDCCFVEVLESPVERKSVDAAFAEHDDDYHARKCHQLQLGKRVLLAVHNEDDLE